MFDKHNIDFDQTFKNILENGQEDVPAHVWDGVSAGLDKMNHKKVVAIWWRRAAITITSAAAVIAAILIINTTSSDSESAVNETSDIVAKAPESGKLQEVTIIKEEQAAETIIAALTVPTDVPIQTSYAPKTAAALDSYMQEVTVSENSKVAAQSSEEKSGMPVADAASETVVPAENTVKSEILQNETYGYESDYDWYAEDDVEKKRPNVSLNISGLTSSNNMSNSTRVNPFRMPSKTPVKDNKNIKETSTNTRYGIPVSAGIGVKIGFNSKWSLGIGVNYTMLGREFYGTYINTDASDGAAVNISSDIKNVQHYVGVPVNIYYNVIQSNNINFYAYAGGTIEKCIHDKYTLLGTSIIHTDKPAGVQMSANIGIGVEFMLGRHLGLYIDPSLRYYFNSSNQPKSIRTVQPLSPGIELGLRFRL